MKIKMNIGTLHGITNTIKEITDHSASQFVADHYNEMVLNAQKMGVCQEKCNDIVHDVYMSLLKAEENGESYDVNGGKDGNMITVDQYVYGRMKGYSKNRKYQSDSADGKGKEVCASSSTTEAEDLSGAQLAYEMAPSYDEIERVEVEMSLPEEINYILSFQSQVSMDIRFVLKNISKLARMSFDVSIMAELRNLIVGNEDFKEALADVVKYAGVNPSKYDVLVASI